MSVKNTSEPLPAQTVKVYSSPFPMPYPTLSPGSGLTQVTTTIDNGPPPGPAPIALADLHGFNLVMFWILVIGTPLAVAYALLTHRFKKTDGTWLF